MRSSSHKKRVLHFILELIHPSHVTTADTISSCAMQSSQRPVSKFTTKKGSQQTIKTPELSQHRFYAIRQVAVERKRKLLVFVKKKDVFHVWAISSGLLNFHRRHTRSLYSSYGTHKSPLVIYSLLLWVYGEEFQVAWRFSEIFTGWIQNGGQRQPSSKFNVFRFK